MIDQSYETNCNNGTQGPHRMNNRFHTVVVYGVLSSLENKNKRMKIKKLNRLRNNFSPRAVLFKLSDQGDTREMQIVVC